MILLVVATAIGIPLGLDRYLPVPEDNQLTPAKVALGARLFRDPVLSSDSSMSCAQCHDPRRDFTDGRPLAVGARGGRARRNAPTLVNRAYGRSQFWDGRARTLEEQVLEPITNPTELALPIDEAVARLTRTPPYRRRFQSAFGGPPNALDLSRALASYVRTILAGNSAFDRAALSPDAQRGLEIFRGKGGCATCHSGPTLSDERFHNTGIAWRTGEWQDVGRFVVTGVAADRGAFKTPTLRQVARTAPYMHDGSLPNLHAVIDYYDRGGNPAPGLDGDIRPLRLTDAEKDALVSFLRSLTGEVREGSRFY